MLLVDLTEIKNQYYRWIKLLPQITPYFAIKSNPLEPIIEVLHNLGCHFDVASKNEIKKVIELGIDPSKIVYANPCKHNDFIKYSREQNVNLLVADCETELCKIKSYHSKAKILIRIKTDDSKSKCKFNTKFGVDINAVEPLLKLSKKLDLNVCGVSFHVGSGCQDENVYETALKYARRVFDIAKKHEIYMDILDIGGGFPGVSVPNSISFEKVVDVINSSIELYFKDIPYVQFIAEPGRYFVESSCTLICEVIGKKKLKNIKTGKIHYTYYISDGVYGTFSGIMFDYSKFEIIPPYNKQNNPTFETTVFGPTCDSLDMVSKEIQLPKLSIGDKITVKNIGAYSVASGTEFNGFEKPEIHYFLRKT